MITTARNSLPVISVKEPCPATWDSMIGDEKRRFCTHCNRHVHDLSALTTAEAADLICQSAERLCIRYQPTPDGAIKTLDYSPRTRADRWWKRWIAVGAVVAVGA